MYKLKIVGVPEHFNYPWQIALNDGLFAKENIDLQWSDIPEGTGKMCQMLREGTTDLAVILTEGIIKDIVNGNPINIIQEYVASPLIWGIHVGSNSKFTQISELENARIAVSRYGSGSELMAYIHAEKMGWDTSKLNFVVVNTLDGAIDALTNNQADYFMWEHFMTKPIVDSGIFRRLDDCPTPWPSFVIASRKESEIPNEIINKVLEIINKTTSDFKNIPHIESILAAKYNQKMEDISKWLLLTNWSQKQLSEAVVSNVQEQLLHLQIISKKVPFDEIVIEM